MGVRATERCGEEPSRLLGQAGREEHVHMALDGKTRQRTLGHEQPDHRSTKVPSVDSRGSLQAP